MHNAEHNAERGEQEARAMSDEDLVAARRALEQAIGSCSMNPVKRKEYSGLLEVVAREQERRGNPPQT